MISSVLHVPIRSRGRIAGAGSAIGRL